jgi:hypothetical protein
MSDDEFLAAFEATTLPLSAFNHRAHLRAGYLYLSRHGLGVAIDRFGRSLRAFAAANGKQGLYHETITVAFLALINERIAKSAASDWETFIAANADLTEGNCLAPFYAPEELASPEARAVFLLPRKRVA